MAAKEGLVSLSADVNVTLEIHAHVPGGIDDRTVRVLTANAKALNFSNHGFEVE